MTKEHRQRVIETFSATLFARIGEVTGRSKICSAVLDLTVLVCYIVINQIKARGSDEEEYPHTRSEERKRPV